VHRVCVRKRTYRRADFTVPDNTRKALVSSSCSYRPGALEMGLRGLRCEDS
jgi:hypothetical protein